jgi:dTMP kinase
VPVGAGKTTLADRLRRRAERAAIRVLVTREPGGTVVGERVRELLLDPAAHHTPRTDALLFNAARAQLVADVVRPALREGVLVVSTRFGDSTLAYQGAAAGLPIDDLRALERFATDGLVPDLTVLLDVPVSVGLARKDAERTRFESAFGLDFHERVRAGFLALAAEAPSRWVVVAADGPEDAVADRVAAAVSGLPGLEGLASEPPAPVERIGR